MPEVVTAVEDSLDVDDQQRIIGGVVTYNDSQVGAENYRPVFVVARDGGAIVGGLLGYTHWEWLSIHHLWVAEPFRRQGIASRLIEAAEREARHRGCTFAHCDTFEFQALPFYRRHGYTVFGNLADYPAGHTRYFLQKRDLS